MKITHKKFGEYELKVDSLTQGDLENYYDELVKVNPEYRKSSVLKYTGDTVRCIVALGWLEPKVEVNKESPGKIRWIAQEFNEVVADALSIDPN